MKYSRADLIELLRRSHSALEAVTDLAGCSFPVAMVLTDCENCLNDAENAGGQDKPAAPRARGLHLVH